MSAAPVIGISPNDQPPGPSRKGYRGKTLEFTDAALAEGVVRAGGVPVTLCRGIATAALALADRATATIARVDGLLLSGGADIDPGTWGQPALREAWPGQPDRDRWELALYRAALRRRVPILGVCRGCQLINVAEGGTLWSDVPTLRPRPAEVPEVTHRSEETYDQLTHTLSVEPHSEAAALFHGAAPVVNSVHHQGIREVGLGLRVTARAPDGLPEAVERRGEPWVLGVQWHPEWMGDDAVQARLLHRFVSLAGRAS